MLDGLMIAQINLGRSRIAMAKLVNKITEQHLDVLLIQEPYFISGQLPLLAKYRKVHQAERGGDILWW